MSAQETLAAGLDLLSDFLDEPDRLAREVLDQAPVGLGFLAYLAAGAGLYAAWRVEVPQPRAGLWGFGLILLWLAASGVMLTALIHLLASMGRRASSPEGSAASLFVFLGLSELPWALAVPLALLLQLAAPARAGLAALAFTGLGCASLALKARFIRLNYDLPGPRAWALLALPYAAGLGFLLAGAALSLWGCVSLLASWM